MLFPQLRDAFDATTGEVAARHPRLLRALRGGPARLGHDRRAPRAPARRAGGLRRLRGRPRSPRRWRRRSGSSSSRAPRRARPTPSSRRCCWPGLAEVVAARAPGARGGDLRRRADRRDRARARGRRRCSARSTGGWPSRPRRGGASRSPSSRRPIPSACRTPSRRACARCSRAASACCRRAAFAGYAGVTSLGFLVALRCRRRFGLGSSARGARAGRLRRRGHAHRAPVGAARRSPRARSR